jgi:hypothetical protein
LLFRMDIQESANGDISAFFVFSNVADT